MNWFHRAMNSLAHGMGLTNPTKSRWESGPQDYRDLTTGVLYLVGGTAMLLLTLAILVTVLGSILIWLMVVYVPILAVILTIQFGGPGLFAWLVRRKNNG